MPGLRAGATHTGVVAHFNIYFEVHILGVRTFFLAGCFPALFAVAFLGATVFLAEEVLLVVVAFLGAIVFLAVEVFLVAASAVKRRWLAWRRWPPPKFQKREKLQKRKPGSVGPRQVLYRPVFLGTDSKPFRNNHV